MFMKMSNNIMASLKFEPKAYRCRHDLARNVKHADAFSFVESGRFVASNSEQAYRHASSLDVT